MKALNELIRLERYGEAWPRLRDLTQKAESYSELAALCRLHQGLMARDPDRPVSRHLRVSLLGTGTTDFVAPALALALEAWNLSSEIQRTGYNTYAREMLDAGSDTARFRPDVAVVVNSPMSLPVRPTQHDGDTAGTRVDEAVAHWLDLCKSLHDHAGCDIILDNYHPVAPSAHGNLASKLPWSLNTFLRHVNLELGRRAPSFVHLNDVDLLASRHGLGRWFDVRRWYEAKTPVSLQCLAAYVRSLARIIAAVYGRTAKCLVLDLDNTLWGGVVGDDGVDGIKIGQGDPVGEAFVAFQEYLVELKQRGVLLAVSSKNEMANALAPFSQRPEMALKRDDLVAFRANWEPKPDNLREIARELNLGLDALVFVDDNPREREHVRQQLPDVRVVDLSEDAADYPRLLDDTGWLETVHIGDEDRARTEQYRANQHRVEVQQVSGDYESYLASLAQVGVVDPYEPRYLDRIAQLVNKTNQFNLTTRRQTRSEVELEMNDSDRLTAWVRLSDRFGDNGLISAFSAYVRGEELTIDQWLMSCRVLSRRVEHLLLNWVVERARVMNIKRLRGVYIPTAKNGLVAGHYASLGFTQHDSSGSSGAGVTEWCLELDEYAPFDVPIEVVHDY